MDDSALESLDRVLDKARLIERVGVNVDLHVVLVRDLQAAVDRGGSGAPVLVELTISASLPAQGASGLTSWSFNPAAPKRTWSSSPAGPLSLPFPVKAKFIGIPSVAAIIVCMYVWDGVAVVAFVPAAGPVPPPTNVVWGR